MWINRPRPAADCDAARLEVGCLVIRQSRCVDANGNRFCRTKQFPFDLHRAHEGKRYSRPMSGRPDRMRDRVQRGLVVLGLMLLASCATLPPPAAKVPEHALATPRVTYSGKQVLAAAPTPEASGFRLLEAGEDAFSALDVLIDGARQSLDLQYYIIRDDGSARKLLRRVYAAAADRGVKVRILVDDLNTAGQEDILLCMAHQRGIEVRLYNPFPSGRFSTLSRVVASATDAERISARMHNKMLVADNVLAVTGGRNLGDAYFVQGKQTNFLDLDLLVTGAVVRKLSASFDAFWNHDLAYPIATLVKRKAECSGADPVRPNGDPAAHEAASPSAEESPRALAGAEVPAVAHRASSAGADAVGGGRRSNKATFREIALGQAATLSTSARGLTAVRRRSRPTNGKFCLRRSTVFTSVSSRAGWPHARLRVTDQSASASTANNARDTAIRAKR